MEDVIFTLLVLAVGVGVHQVVLQRHPRAFEQRLLTWSFVAHLAAAFGIVLVYKYYYGYGDMLSYYFSGVPAADALRYDFTGLFPEVVNLLFQRESFLPMTVRTGGSTGSIQAVAILLLFLLGNSLYAASAAIAVGSYVAKVLIYRALRPEFPEALHPKVLLGAALSPSGVVWTSVLLKEPVLMVFFGPAFLGLRWLIEGRRLALAVVLLVVGTTGVLLMKAYVVIALALAGGVWMFWARTLRSGGSLVVKPVYLLVAAGLVSVAFTVVTAVMPQLSTDRVAEAMEAQRKAAATEGGGSNFYQGGEPTGPLEDEGEEAPQRGLASQLGYMPFALMTALFRPFLFESFSAMQFLNSLEMTWLLWMFVQVVRRNRWAELVKRVTGNPGLMFCAAFVLVLALGTGLATANLGTLSRYRAPMMPFFLVLLAVLREPEGARQPAPALAAPLRSARA